MLALINASLTPDVADAVSRERSWELRHAEQISSAVGQMSPEERLAVRALIVEAEPVGAKLISQLRRLELIACLRSDPVNVDVAAATARRVVVIHTPGRNADAVAEFTLGLCLAAIRHIPVTHHLIVSGQLTTAHRSRGVNVAAGDTIWRPDDPAAPIPYVMFQGRLLSSLVLGVIGFGSVGQAVAGRFAGLVREIHVTDPAVPPEEIRDRGYLPTPLDQLLPAADVVTIHARSKAQIIGRSELKQMKPGSFLINTARATVLDYDALMDSLDSGALRGAALDVYPDEPLPASSPLRHQRGLTLTPHIAGAAAEVIGRQSEILLDALRGLYSHRTWPGLPVCNPELRLRWMAEHAAP